MARSLWIYLAERRVARLEHERGRMILRYDSAEVPAISVRLPARGEPYDDGACRPFFANLLPEGAWREALCRQLGIAPADDFSLLEAIGEDCAGAVTLSKDADRKPDQGRYLETSEEELAQWVKHPAKRPTIELAPGLRLSLAGAQDKLLIHLQAKRPYLCETGAPSTVILKPDIRDPFNEIELTGLNELLAMRLAAAAGLTVASVFWFAGAFAVQRYDREREGERWRRLHQEDFAQLLGLPAAAKYDVGWNDAFDVVTRHTSTPAKARMRLIERLLFDLIVGNNDAHGKNFALLHHSDGTVSLAPAYDVLCTELYPSLSSSLAMSIGDATTRAELNRAAWTALCADVGIGLSFVRQRAGTLVDAVASALHGHLQAAEQAAPALRSDIYPARRREELFSAFEVVVRRNCDLLVRSFV